MKYKVRNLLITTVLLVTAIVFGLGLFRFMKPMADLVYDLSAIAADGQEKAEDKGWEVFTQDGNTKTALTPNGTGGFSGLSYPGQTFYFSRVMHEQLDSATLRLGAANRTLSVYLDGELLYTDCPEQDGGIGSLSLPMLDYDRLETLLVTLPADYAGKTLTIAQSTDTGGSETLTETATDTVWPCDVVLYCGYAYESELVAESFRSAAPASLLFAMAVILSTVFCLQMWSRRKSNHQLNVSLLCIALTLFLYALWTAYSAPYAVRYSGLEGLDAVPLCRAFALLTLLVFLAMKGGRYRTVLWVFAGLQGIRCLFTTLLAFMPELLTTTPFQYFTSLESELAVILAMLTAIGLGFFMWRKDSHFYRIFSTLSLAGIAVYLICVCLSPLLAPAWWESWREQLRVALQLFTFDYFRYPLMNLTVCTAAIAAIAEFLWQESRRRMETQFLADRMELAQINYENLRAHDEEVMMLRHDMANHLRTLRTMTDSDQTAAYLDDLIGQNEKIRPVIQSGNEMLDILLNGKLAPAVATGLSLDIIRMNAPQKLPMSDAELSSLVLNILDNALKATAHAEHPSIRLDLHCKSDFFVFTCENTTAYGQPVSKEKPLSGHGLGLKIIRQTIEKCEGLVNTEKSDDSFKVTVAIPLTQSTR